MDNKSLGYVGLGACGCCLVPFFWFSLVISLSIIFVMLKLVWFFWLILLLWIGLYLLFFFFKYFIKYALWIIAILLIISLAGAYKPNIFGIKTSESGSVEEINGIRVSDCYKTNNDAPETLSEIKVSAYSGTLGSQSADPKDATNTKTFSLSGLKNKTSAESFYSKIEMADGSAMTGYDGAMEVCNENNKTTFSYGVRNDEYTPSTPGANGSYTTGLIHYLHGGNYIIGPGTYRIDSYVADKNGVWHLINRVSDITITE